jgi:hypothetical protein
VQNQEREPEQPERVLRAQVAVPFVDLQLLGEAVDGERRQVARGGVDVAQVVARVPADRCGC